MKYLFTADIHGSETQYNKISSFVRQNDFDVLFLGGDLFPKDGGKWFPENEQRTVGIQKEFVRNFFNDWILDTSKYTDIFYIYGNDDFASTQEVLIPNTDKIHYFENGGVLNWQGIDIVGYPYVGLTPYLQKDWEKWDDFESELHKKFITKGFHSNKDEHFPVDYESEPFSELTISDDLSRLFSSVKNETVIGLFHETPFNTHLDQTFFENAYDGSIHLGSKSVRRIIEKYQPDLTFHGHIHESFLKSGHFSQTIGNTLSFNPGNGMDKDNPSVIVGNLVTGVHERITL